MRGIGGGEIEVLRSALRGLPLRQALLGFAYCQQRETHTLESKFSDIEGNQLMVDRKRPTSTVRDYDRLAFSLRLGPGDVRALTFMHRPAGLFAALLEELLEEPPGLVLRPEAVDLRSAALPPFGNAIGILAFDLPDHVLHEVKPDRPGQQRRRKSVDQVERTSKVERVGIKEECGGQAQTSASERPSTAAIWAGTIELSTPSNSRSSPAPISPAA